jgi:enoyl-CoA hydratase/carnithine racemase
MDYQQILYAQSGAVLTLTMNRPEALNAMTKLMRRELCHALDRANSDDSVRAIIITGAGRAYCAGVDLSDGAAMFKPAADSTSEDRVEAGRDGAGILALKLYNSLKPVTGAVNGPVVGVGATMLVPMDIRLATENARVGFVFARRGIVTDGCASWFLARLVGISQALDWTMSGRLVPAKDASEAGLLRSVVTSNELLPQAYALGSEIADHCAPVSVALIRQSMWYMLGTGHPSVAHHYESQLLSARGNSADAREGVASFLAKHAAVFPDHVSTDMPPGYPWGETGECILDHG